MTAPIGRHRSHSKPKLPHLLITSLAAVTLLFSTACGESPPPTPEPEPTQSQSLPLNTPRPTQTGSRISLVGELDPTFGHVGKVTTDLGSTLDEIRGMAVQPDGKIVVVGEAWPERQPKFTLARYHSDGSLDEDFGDAGTVVTSIFDESWDRGSPHAILLQPDGKIVIGGGSKSPDYAHGIFALLRYTPDGSLDRDFGHDGIVQTALYEESYSSSDDEIYALALQPDGKIVAAGSTGTYPPDVGVARYNPDGSLDETFGDGGKVVTDFGGDDDGAYAVGVQDDGKIVVGGYTSAEGGIEFYDFALVRYNEDGTLDKDFGDGGWLRTDLDYGQQDEAHSMVIHPDGKITLGGPSVVGAQFCGASACWKFGYGLVQYNPDGSLDEDFGHAGIVTRDFTVSAGNYALVRLPNGQLATGGYSGQANFSLALYNADGTLDESFGKEGVVITSFGEYQDQAYAIALQPDGKLLLAGTAVVDTEDILNGDFAIARYK
jgi:uncharacterized delta-60 repeat protein